MNHVVEREIWPWISVVGVVVLVFYALEFAALVLFIRWMLKI